MKSRLAFGKSMEMSQRIRYKIPKLINSILLCVANPKKIKILTQIYIYIYIPMSMLVSCTLAKIYK